MQISLNNIVALNILICFFFKKKLVCSYKTKSLWETPFLLSTNEIYIKFKYTRSNFFVQRIYLRLKFSDEMNGCTYTRLRSVKGLLLTFRSEREKGNNGWHLTGVHYILFYTFLYKWQYHWKIWFSLFFIEKKIHKNKPYSFRNNYFYNICTTLSSLSMS